MKTKVLIVNKFYYPRGGDCVCTINLERLLSDKGHETAVFAMQYPENIDTPWSRYFASEVSFGGGIANLLNGVKRTLGLGDIATQFKKIIADFKPDVVHLNNIHSYLSPVLATIAHKAGARVVWTLHDYKLVCPSYSCTLNGKPCELCLTGNKSNVLKNRCMKGSLPASAVAWIEALKWNRRVLERNTDLFIAPSEFMRSMMIKGGFNPHKVVTLTNFVDPVKLATLGELSGEHQLNTICYIGRLSPEKGIENLLQAASTLPYTLTVAGDGPLAESLMSKYRDNKNIKFVGRLDAENVGKLLSSSYLSVMPSVCYENNPLGVIESLCAGTPVVGARIGGIPELLQDNNGITYQWDSIESLRQAITQAMDTEWNNKDIASKALQRFSPDSHYTSLTTLYKK